MSILLQRISEGEDLETQSGFGAVQTEFGNLPLRELSYHSRLFGMSLHTTIVQTYCNPFDEPIEANYIFPLAYGQAVIACEMRVANRVIHAKLKERGEARRDYADAIRRGHRAALLEENRPETFLMKVGNIPPGESIQVCIQTVSQLVAVHGQWTLRLPLVVAPRYTSGLPLPRSNSGPGTQLDTDQVPDASCVTPSTWLPGFASPVDLKLVVDIDMATLGCQADWPSQLKSSLHTALIEKDANQSSRCRVELLPQERVNRDFILRGQVADDRACSAVVCETSEPSPTSQDVAKSAGRTTFAVTIVPPRKTASVPRQVVFLLDRSGSMTGWKIQAARRGLCRLVDRLHDADQFQVVAFDDQVTPYHMADGMQANWKKATDANRFEAVRWLSRIETRGGTEMGKAIAAALTACRSGNVEAGSNNRAVVLVTDGQITGEDAILRLIDQMPTLEVPRIFCLGIDRAVNASVLERVARRTGGTFELVESEKRLDEVLESFADEIAAPSLTELSVSAKSGGDLNLAPSYVRALYAGRSQTIYGRTDQDKLTLLVRGRLADGQPYEECLEWSAQSQTASHACLRALWGKERVRQLEDELLATGVSIDALKQQIIECSLECQVLSRLTAFVAVDTSEQVTQGELPHSMLVPGEMPEGWGRPSQRLDPSILLRVPRPVVPTQAAVHAKLPSFETVAEQAAARMLQQGTIADTQLGHARALAAERGCDVCQALITLQHATSVSVAQSIAAVTQTTYISVSQLKIDPSIIMLVPESVARENHVLPMAESGGALTVVMSNPHDLETIEKLRFIMNRSINAFCGASDEISQAINHYYGQVRGESTDSILCEFTDTQIDFTETLGFAETDIRGTVGNNYPDFDCANRYCDSESESIVSARARRRPLSSQPQAGLTAREDTPLIRRSESHDAEEPVNAAIVRFVELLLHEALQLRASHVILLLTNGELTKSTIGDGLKTNKEQIPRRLWFSVLNRLKLMAKLDITNRNGVQTGTIKITIEEQDFELTLHAAKNTLMIEMPPAKSLTNVPIEIENWWSEQRAATT